MSFNPGAAFMLSDNDGCKRILSEAGLLGAMIVAPPSNAVMARFETETHWCLGEKHIGHQVESDNGYIVIMLPKSQCSKERAQAFFQEHLSQFKNVEYFDIPLAPSL